MPGYDKSKIVGLAEEELDEYTCGICQDIIKNPLFTKCCRQTYCEDCINEWLTSRNTCPYDRKKLTTKDLIRPPRILLNVVNNMKIKCDYQENGCSIEIKIGELTRHQEECEHRPGRILLCDVCGLEKEMEIHDCIGNLVIKNKSILDGMARLRYEMTQLNGYNSENIDDLVISARNSLDNYVIEEEDQISLVQRVELIESCKKGLLRRDGGFIASRILNEIEKNVELGRIKNWAVFVSKRGLHSFNIRSNKYMKIVFNGAMSIAIFTTKTM